MDSIKEIGLSFAIVAAYAVDVWRKFKFLKSDVPEVRYYYFFKYGHDILVYPYKDSKFSNQCGQYFKYISMKANVINNLCCFDKIS